MSELNDPQPDRDAVAVSKHGTVPESASLDTVAEKSADAGRTPPIEPDSSLGASDKPTPAPVAQVSQSIELPINPAAGSGADNDFAAGEHQQPFDLKQLVPQGGASSVKEPPGTDSDTLKESGSADNRPELPEVTPLVDGNLSGGQDAKKSRRRENPQGKTATDAGPTRPRAAKKGRTKSPAGADVLAELLEKSGLAVCRRSADRVGEAEIGALTLLHSHLVDVYSVDAETLVANGDLRKICKLVEVPWTKATRGNPRVAIFRICHPGITIKRASRYAIALRYCSSMNVTPVGLPAFLQANGGVDGCVEKFRETQPRRERRATRLVVEGAVDVRDGRYELRIEVVDGRATVLGEMVLESDRTVSENDSSPEEAPTDPASSASA